MIPDHDPDDPTPSRVYVNGIRIPTGDVRLYYRKEGPVAFSRYVEGEFPSPYNGVDWINAFDGITPEDQSDYDRLRVDVRDRATGDYHTPFRGIVTGVGSAPDGGSKWYTFRSQGPEFLVDKTPASVTFKNASLKDGLSYVASQLDDRVPFSAVSATQIDGEIREGRTREPVTFPEATAVLYDVLDLPINTPRTFHFGKHTLEDVISWISEKTNTYIWLSPTPEGVALVANRQPSGRLHRADYLGGDLHVVENDALSELRPVNTQLVKAPSAESRGGDTDKAAEKYHTAKAVHQPLFRRAGERELYADTERLSDAHTVSEARNEARRLLKNAVDQARGGDLVSLLRSPIRPFDRVEAKPVCESESGSTTPSITYEVARVVHHARASGISETKLNVGVRTDAEEDIAVFDSWQQSP